MGEYGHFTERMKQDSAARMEGFIKDVLGLQRENIRENQAEKPLIP